VIEKVTAFVFTLVVLLYGYTHSLRLYLWGYKHTLIFGVQVLYPHSGVKV